jgi:DNA-damage-inducible protein D
MKKKINTEKHIAVFEGKEVRRTWHNEQWYFAVNDVVELLSETTNVTDYIKKMRQRDEELGKGWGQFVTPLSIETKGGIQKVNCANLSGIFRIIQSIPSPKAEPFKLWLAKVGQERIVVQPLYQVFPGLPYKIIQFCLWQTL